MMPLCLEEGIGVIPWSPLARGRLTRPWSKKSATKRAGSDAFGNEMYARTEEADRMVIDRVNEVAKARGIPPAQIALAWLFTKPYITAPIVGATKPHHLQDAVAALTVQLSPGEIAQLEEPYVPHPVLGFE
jgi:aryl-alcohol dehydrogenase-like predicted oxidoreductase